MSSLVPESPGKDVAVLDKASVMPYPESVVGFEVIDENAGVAVTLDAAVSRPWASTVKVDT
jgi:hypothetical protein